MTPLDHYVAAVLLAGLALVWIREALDERLSWLGWIGNGLVIAGVARLACLLVVSA